MFLKFISSRHKSSMTFHRSLARCQRFFSSSIILKQQKQKQIHNHRLQVWQDLKPLQPDTNK